MSKDAATCVQAPPPPLPLEMPLGMVWLAIPTTQEENFPCLIYLSDPLRYSRLSLGPGIIPTVPTTPCAKVQSSLHWLEHSRLYLLLMNHILGLWWFYMARRGASDFQIFN